MDHTSLSEEALLTYEKEGEEIIRRMLTIVMRAQRKVDDKKYRELLEKLEKTQ